MDIVYPANYEPLVVCEARMQAADPAGILACWNAYYDAVRHNRFDDAARVAVVGCDAYQRPYFCALAKRLAGIKPAAAKRKADAALPDATAAAAIDQDDAEFGFMMFESAYWRVGKR